MQISYAWLIGQDQESTGGIEFRVHPQQAGKAPTPADQQGEQRQQRQQPAPAADDRVAPAIIEGKQQATGGKGIKTQALDIIPEDAPFEAWCQ